MVVTLTQEMCTQEMRLSIIVLSEGGLEGVGVVVQWLLFKEATLRTVSVVCLFSPIYTGSLRDSTL